MSGDPTNVNIWAFADVLVTYDLDAAIPDTIDDDFDPDDWDFVGLLDGDDGFAKTRDEDKNDHFAWGGVYEGTSRAHFKMSQKFTCHEDNDVTFGLVWPGSTRGGTIVVPKPIALKIAFQTQGAVHKERFISVNYAEVEPDGDLNENETDVTKIPLVATIFPDASVTPAQLWHHQTTEVTGS